MVEERIFIMTFRWRGGKKGKKNPQTVKFGDRAVLFFAEKRKIKRRNVFLYVVRKLIMRAM